MTIDFINNPFAKKTNKPEVSVCFGQGGYANTVIALKYFDLSPAKGKRVLIKPNAGRIAKQGQGITTDPDVVAAAIDIFREAGAFVAVGESPITGVNTIEAFKSTGIASAAEKRDCPLIDLDAKSFIKVIIPEGIAVSSLKLCEDINDFDILVSVPVMKTHMHTGVTLAVKNMKGCLWRRSKVQLHMLNEIPGSSAKPLDIAIADMAGVLKPHFSIIDGTTGMEGMGPGAGTPKQADVIVAGTDAFAADSVACSIMGIDAESVPHLSMGAARGYGIIDLQKINIFPESWKTAKTTFQTAPAELSFSFEGIHILDKNSCSACQSTLMLFLQKYSKTIMEYFRGQNPVFIAIGKGNKNIPDNAICVGNCTSAQCKNRIYIPGCPPVGSEILKIITGDLDRYEE